MLIEKRKLKINFKNINFVLHNPSILKTIIQGKVKMRYEMLKED